MRRRGIEGGAVKLGAVKLGSRAVAIAAALALTIAAAPAAAQDGYSVHGRVAGADGAAIDGAMVVALALPDSVLTKFSLSDGGGQFTLTRVPAGDYLLQITMVGRETIRQPFTLTDSNLDAGTIALEVLAVDMDELVVSIEHVPFVNRRDTLAYNANAFV
ncbi:MAG: carboxypeptidase-like regulatory domain-containing protein, partial [Longimicrobiales bacterium]|nr:carboxypeptidase-like regulatory domain-containing protein [Longimicrobiales bacterium]